ncbi:MAG: lactate permease LctP family transporter [Syntrophales bacterium]|jgi:lactate permease
MTWTIEMNPLNNLGLSALVAAIPILYLFWALAYKRMKGHWAALSAVAIAVVISILVYGMPVKYSLLSTLYGMLFGLWPVCWIVITAVFIYNLSIKTGEFEIIKNSLATISDDRRMQALLIAFSFGAFIEGAAGFGTPVAITAAMLAGLGFNPLYAAGICLLANTAPVAFGAIGIPIIVGAQVAGIDQMALSQMVGRQLPFISILIPMYMVILMSGWKKGTEVWPAAFVSGGSFAFVQWFTSNYIGPLLPDIIASIVSIVCLIIFLRFWHPKESWHFADEPKSNGRAALEYTGGQVFRAWAPFIILSIFVAAWGVKAIKEVLDYYTLVKIPIPDLHNMVIRGGKPMAAVYAFNILSAAGTAILFAGIFSIPVMGASMKTAAEVFGQTMKTLRWPILTISTILGFAYIMNFSGMAITLGNAFATTGAIFPFFAAFLGWLGVFMTGSDTSSNALFGKLQEVTATQIGVDPVVTVATNSSGGVCGKMISPQSLSVATAATGLVGQEGDIFRFTLKHSIILTAVIGAMAYLQAYYLTWMIPIYTRATAAMPAVAAAAKKAFDPTEGGIYLFIAAAAVLILTISAKVAGKGKLSHTQ